jgi:hypothetical protein
MLQNGRALGLIQESRAYAGNKKGADSSPCLTEGTGKHPEGNTKAGGAPDGAPPCISQSFLKNFAGFSVKR